MINNLRYVNKDTDGADKYKFYLLCKYSIHNKTEHFDRTIFFSFKETLV